MSQAHKPDIIDFRLNHTMDNKAFRHVIDILASQDIHLVGTHSSNRVCESCKEHHIVDMDYGLSARDVSYNYSLCLNCWHVGFWIPIYENEADQND